MEANKVHYCQNCGKSLCPEHTYFYVDGNNEAITRNSPRLCKECYEKIYHTNIKTEIDIFKEKFIKALVNAKKQNNIKTIEIDRLIEYINKCK